MQEKVREDEIDWRECGAVEFDPEKLGGRAAVGPVRMLADWVIDNYEDGITAEEICESYGLELEPGTAIMAYASQMHLKASA